MGKEKRECGDGNDIGYRGEWLSLGGDVGGGFKGKGRVDFYEVSVRNGLDLCGGPLKQSQAIQQFRVTEYQSAATEWQIS